MATLRWGFGATSSPRQTPLPGRGQAHPRKMGRLGVKRVFEQLGFSHEESHGAEDVIRGRSPTTIMVPFWQRGQRERSMPVRGNENTPFPSPWCQDCSDCYVSPRFPCFRLTTAVSRERSESAGARGSATVCASRGLLDSRLG